MKKLNKKNKNIYYNNEKNLEIYDKIERKEYKIIKILKDDKRSYVAVIKIDNKNYVLKIPREKNTRKWQRFLSIFRKSESYREFKSIENIKSLGFNAPTPYIAIEEKKYGMVTNSYYLAEFINAREGKKEDIKIISKVLNDIHKLNYLHGDSHVANFLIDLEDKNKVYIIDTKFMKNKYGNCGKIFEFIYLEESVETSINYDKKSIYYQLAMILKRYLLWLGDMKKIIRRKK